MDNSEIVESAGYEEAIQFIPWEVWMNRNSRMAFNVQGRDDADERWLAKEVQTIAPPGRFVFYCAYGSEMDEALCQRRLEAMGLGQLKAEVRHVTPKQ